MEICSQKKLKPWIHYEFLQTFFFCFLCLLMWVQHKTYPNHVYILAASVWVPLLQCKEYLSHVSIKNKWNRAVNREWGEKRQSFPFIYVFLCMIFVWLCFLFSFICLGKFPAIYLCISYWLAIFKLFIVLFCLAVQELKQKPPGPVRDTFACGERCPRKK